MASLEGGDVSSARGTMGAKTELSGLSFKPSLPLPVPYFLFLSQSHVINQQGLSTVQTPWLHSILSVRITLLWFKPSSTAHWDCSNSFLRDLSWLYNPFSTTEAKWSFQNLSQIMSPKFTKGFPSHLEWNPISLSWSSGLPWICSLLTLLTEPPPTH